LRRYLAEASKIIQKIDPLSGSTQANESFHAVKGKYTDKRLNFTTLTDARFALGAISQSRNPGWQDDLRESLGIPQLLTECSKILRDLESKCERKNEKTKEELESRKKNETRNRSRAKADRKGKEEDDDYFRK
jgi:hypothetical protein